MNSYQPTTPQRRHYERQETTLQATLMVAEENFACRLINISVSGARINLRQHFRPGDRLQLAIQPFGVFPCEIVWQKGQECGIKFLLAAEQMAPVLSAIAVYG